MRKANLLIADGIFPLILHYVSNIRFSVPYYVSKKSYNCGLFLRLVYILALKEHVKSHT